MPPDAFDALAGARRRAPARRAATAPQRERGRAAFLAQRCDACHTVRGVVDGGAGWAPTSPTSAAALHLGAGTLPQRRGTAWRGWIADVQHAQARRAHAVVRPARSTRADAGSALARLPRRSLK